MQPDNLSFSAPSPPPVADAAVDIAWAVGHHEKGSLPEDNHLGVDYHMSGEAVADSMFDLPSKGLALPVQIRRRNSKVTRKETQSGDI